MHWSIVRATGRRHHGSTGLTIFAFALMMQAFGLCTASSQTLQFIKNGPAVLGPGGSGAWDVAWTNFVSVIHADSQYVMWYSGATNSNGSNLGTGRATSTDGILWQKDAHNPVFAHGPAGAWDAGSAWIPKVIRQGAVYTMWYTGTADPNAPWQIGRAVSNDGVTWRRDTSGAELTLGSSSQWDAALVHTGSVLYDGTTYRMWYTGIKGDYGNGTSAIGLATSTDGIHWTKYAGNPVLTAGSSGAWDAHGVGDCSVVHNPLDNLYHLFYVGNEIDFFSPGTSGIGHATSPDGIHWTKDASNPVLPNSIAGWDTHVYAPFVILDAHKYKIWYSSDKNIGYAWSPDPAFTAVAEDRLNGTPLSFLLEQNYPNPFNPSTTIRYGLPSKSHVTLSVYNTLGQQVAVLQNGEQDAGYHEVRFNASNLSSGVYFYRLRAGDVVQIRKLLLLR